MSTGLSRPGVRLQHCITLSSAEAELVAMSKVAQELLGLMSLAEDLGDTMTGEILADSASALAVVARRGAGKLRHINIAHLWLQELEKRREKPVQFVKVPGTAKPADALTKYLSCQDVGRYIQATGHRLVSGRAGVGLQLQK